MAQTSARSGASRKATLAGATGGMALGAARGAARLAGAKTARRAGSQSRSRKDSRTGRGVGSVAEQLGIVADELRRTRAAAASRRRSPIEVVRQRLTARR